MAFEPHYSRCGADARANWEIQSESSCGKIAGDNLPQSSRIIRFVRLCSQEENTRWSVAQPKKTEKTVISRSVRWRPRQKCQDARFQRLALATSRKRAIHNQSTFWRTGKPRGSAPDRGHPQWARTARSRIWSWPLAAAGGLDFGSAHIEMELGPVVHAAPSPERSGTTLLAGGLTMRSIRAASSLRACRFSSRYSYRSYTPRTPGMT